MYQEILPHVYHNAYKPKQPKDNDIVFGFLGNQVLLKSDQTFFHYQDLHQSTKCTYLFEIDDICFYLADLSNESTTKLATSAMRTYEPKYLGFAAITAWQLYKWMSENKYCGTCGAEMMLDQKERAMCCPSCHHLVYPKIMPAVIVGVKNEKNQILLTKYANSPYKKFALVAGFTEIGETIEETVVREVKEETGLDVTDLQFYKSQPWSYSSTILFGFWAHADSHQPIHMDDGELKEANWYDKDVDVDNLDTASLTAEMIRVFKKGN